MLTLTWINTIVLIVASIVIIMEIVRLMRDSRAQSVVLKELSEAQRALLDALRLLVERPR